MKVAALPLGRSQWPAHQSDECRCRTAPRQPLLDEIINQPRCGRSPLPRQGKWSDRTRSDPSSN